MVVSTLVMQNLVRKCTFLSRLGFEPDATDNVYFLWAAGAVVVETSLCTRLGMACPVTLTDNTFSKNRADVSGSDIYWTDVRFQTTQPGASCILRLLNDTTANGTACSNSSGSSTMTSTSKEFPAVIKAMEGLKTGECGGNKFIGRVSASRQQYCKMIGSRPSQVEVQFDATNRTIAAGIGTEPAAAAAAATGSGSGGRHLLQQPEPPAAADEGFVVANDAPFNVSVTLKDALGNPVKETGEEMKKTL